MPVLSSSSSSRSHVMFNWIIANSLHTHTRFGQEQQSYNNATMKEKRQMKLIAISKIEKMNLLNLLRPRWGGVKEGDGECCIIFSLFAWRSPSWLEIKQKKKLNNHRRQVKQVFCSSLLFQSIKCICNWQFVDKCLCLCMQLHMYAPMFGLTEQRWLSDTRNVIIMRIIQGSFGYASRCP